jgi:hypothetical protein
MNPDETFNNLYSDKDKKWHLKKAKEV